MVRRRKAIKVVVFFLLSVLLSIGLLSLLPDSKKPITPFLSQLHNDPVVRFRPEQLTLLETTEHDGTKDPFELVPENANVSYIQNVFQTKQGTSSDQAISIFTEKALTNNWKELICEAGNRQCEGSKGDRKIFYKLIGDEETQLQISRTEDTTDSVTVYAFAVNVFDE